MRRVLVALAVLTGCSPWGWAVPPRTFPAEPGPAPIVADAFDSGLGPEQYSLGRWTRDGADLQALRDRVAREAAAHGAHAVLLGDVTARVSRVVGVHDGGPAATGEVVRRQTIEVASTSASVEAFALRRPRSCIGASLACVDPDGLACERVQVLRVVPGGPADQAGLRAGAVVVATDAGPVGHPWDVHRHADRVRSVQLTSTLDGASSQRWIVSADCEGIYGPSSASP
jgi:hypothetical protein